VTMVDATTSDAFRTLPLLVRVGQALLPLLLLEDDHGRNRRGSNPWHEDREQSRAAEHGDRSEIRNDVPRGDLKEETAE